MGNISKRYRAIKEKADRSKSYSLPDALNIIKGTPNFSSISLMSWDSSSTVMFAIESKISALPTAMIFS